MPVPTPPPAPPDEGRAHAASGGPPPHGGWTGLAVGAGRMAAGLSRSLGRGAGGIIGGRVALALAPRSLARLARGRTTLLVSGTNGKTTTSHLLAAATATVGPVAHNASGANMPDGAMAALMLLPDAPFAVLEVDELHLAGLAEAVDPAVVVLLNLSRDQLDRGGEVRAVASRLAATLGGLPATRVVANADDPLTAWVALHADHTEWFAGGAQWRGEACACPGCGHPLRWWRTAWDCPQCRLRRPEPSWRPAGSGDEGVLGPSGLRVPLPLDLPGSFNRGNALAALAASSLVGVPAARAAAAMGTVREIEGRYAVVHCAGRTVRLLLAKNPAGWAATLPLLRAGRPVLLVVNAREADGRDTSWLWDVPFEDLDASVVAVAGERAADLDVRLGYAGVEHATVSDPVAVLGRLPVGPVDVVANYTAFRDLHRRLAGEPVPAPADGGVRALV